MDPSSRLRPVTAWSVSMDLPSVDLPSPATLLSGSVGRQGPPKTPPAPSAPQGGHISAPGAAGSSAQRDRDEGRSGPLQGRRHPLPGLSSTGSPLFPATLQEHPEMALVLRSQLDRPGDTRGARERCSQALDGGVERPRAEGGVCAKTQGRAGSGDTQDSHRESLPPVPDASRKKSRLNSAVGATEGSQTQGPSASRWRPAQPEGHAAPTCPLSSSRADVL